MPCWTRPTRRCCAGSRCSRPRSPRPRRRPYAPAWPPAAGDVVPAALARLADQSLLVAIADASGTRYRALETIRQYGAGQLARDGESDQASSRHLGWCLDAAAALALPPRDDRAWRSAFDQLADELRAALRWAAREQCRPEAYRPAIALAELASGMWRPWYAALWAEAAVVADHPDAAARIRRARLVTLGNPVAAAIVDRAEALAGDRDGALAGDRDGLGPAAAALAAAGCRYQRARTLVAIGGAERLRGEAELAAMGATVMAWPPARG